MEDCHPLQVVFGDVLEEILVGLPLSGLCPNFPNMYVCMYVERRSSEKSKTLGVSEVEESPSMWRSRFSSPVSSYVFPKSPNVQLFLEVKKLTSFSQRVKMKTSGQQ